MKPVRTNKGKLFGMLDTKANKLLIKDGENVRKIKVPPTGLELEYIVRGSPPEGIEIPPAARNA